MSSWIVSAIGGAVAIAVHYLFVRAATGRIEDRLGALVLEATAAVGIAVSFTTGMRGDRVPTTRLGVVYACAAGLAISFSSVLLFGALRRGGPVASTGIIVLGGGVALSALAAPWLFGESFTLRRILGVALGIAAMWVLGTES
jgi:drug/metabolite transporter (DMT)-like permease